MVEYENSRIFQLLRKFTLVFLILIVIV
jgi:hypothetical protein